MCVVSIIDIKYQISNNFPWIRFIDDVLHDNIYLHLHFYNTISIISMNWSKLVNCVHTVISLKTVKTGKTVNTVKIVKTVKTVLTGERFVKTF